MMEQASFLVFAGIPGVAALAAVLFVAGAHRSHRADRAKAHRAVKIASLGVLALGVVTGGLALSGLLARVQSPPLFMPMMFVVFAATLAAARSSLGTNMATGLPLFALVSAQAFRLPLELVMHRAATEGVMPVIMSFSGYNFDVITGATALALGIVLFFAPGLPRFVVVAWNALGTLLLFNIVCIAVAAAPWFAAFGPDQVNEWVLYFPYVLLPTICVPAALFGHIMVARRLIAERREMAAQASAAHGLVAP